MILGFKQQIKSPTKGMVDTHFEKKIKSGEKIHSIREDPHNRWKPGTKVHCATGVRTKHYNCFHQTECSSSQTISIKHNVGQIVVIIDDVVFGEAYHHGLNGSFGDLYEWSVCLDELAQNDGFDSVEDFFEWFSEDYEGKIIHWTDFRYE